MPQEEATINLVKKKYDQVDLIFGTHNIYHLPNLLYDAILSKERVFEVLSFEGEIIEQFPSNVDTIKKHG
jgi:tRNA-2-methylthio-N6-dimethylallyladenosine synthase